MLIYTVGYILKQIETAWWRFVFNTWKSKGIFHLPNFAFKSALLEEKNIEKKNYSKWLVYVFSLGNLLLLWCSGIIKRAQP